MENSIGGEEIFGFLVSSSVSVIWVSSCRTRICVCVSFMVAVSLRLHFEATQGIVQDTKYMMERTAGTPARILPTGEREVRRERIERRLTGLEIGENDDLDVAFGTTDLFSAMWDNDAITYVAWEACPTRSAELEGQKKWTVPRDDQSCVHALSHMLMRRAIGGEIGGIATFETADKIRKRFVKALTAPPADPRFRRPSLEQIRSADRYLWKEVGKKCRRTVRATSFGTRTPADIAIEEVLATHEFAMIIAPTVGGAPGAKREEDATEMSKGQRLRANRAKRKAEEEAAKANKAARNEDAQYRGGPKGGGKGGGRKGATRGSGSSGSAGNVPKELIGMDTRRENGEPRCFGFALGNCNGAKPGERCQKGWHECMRPGCPEKHATVTCTFR